MDAVALDALRRIDGLLEFQDSWVTEAQDSVAAGTGHTPDSTKPVEVVIQELAQSKSTIATQQHKDLLIASIRVGGREVARVEYQNYNPGPAGMFEIPVEDPDGPWVRIGLDYGSVHRLRRAVKNEQVRPELDDVETASPAETSSDTSSPSIGS